VGDLQRGPDDFGEVAQTQLTAVEKERQPNKRIVEGNPHDAGGKDIPVV